MSIGDVFIGSCDDCVCVESACDDRECDDSEEDSVYTRTW